MECISSLPLTQQNRGLKMNSKKAGEEIVSETFTWLIENFSKLQTGKHYSDLFTIAGFKWRPLIWPKGNKVKSEMQFSVYLCIPSASNLEPGWATSAHFSLSVVNQLDSTKTITKATKGCIKEIKENSREWGFKSFMPLSELYDITAGYLVNDICIVEAKLNVSIKTGDQGSNVSGSLEHSGKELSTVNSVQAADSSPAAKTPRSEFQHTPSSEKVCTTPADDGPTDPSLVKELGEVPTNLTGELMEFRGLGQIEKAFVPLLEEICSLHLSLIECLHKRNRKVFECAFTVVGGLLHFLKTAKVKDMTKGGFARLQCLWKDVQMFTFDLAWLEPHVRSALGMKQHLERASRVKRLTEDMDLLGNELKRKRAAIAITEVEFEETKRGLEKEEEGFVAIDIDSQLGYGTH